MAFWMLVVCSQSPCAQDIPIYPAEASDASQEERPIFLSELPISSKDFFGRDSEMKQLCNVFHTNDSDQKTVVIWVLAGFGKSRLALQYIEIFQARYSAILWVNAQNWEGALESFSQAATEIQSRQPSISASKGGQKDLALVNRWLSKKHDSGDWLLVIDSVDDLEAFDCRRLLPRCEHGHVIITSTLSQIAKHMHFHSLELGSLDEIAGTEMLLCRLPSNGIAETCMYK